MKHLQYLLLLFSIILLQSTTIFAQLLSDDDYKKAGWMTTRMYGGQRSGDGPNWLIMNHSVSTTDKNNLVSTKSLNASKLQAGKCFTTDADGAYSLSGGWVDCGDHVKFGQTMFYSAYVVLKGYDVFRAGYDDYYSYDYSGYKAANDFSWAGKKGKPNGIPDVLDELKYQCDFLIKCARNSTTFYSQVGDGGPDHKNWVTSVAMAALPKAEGGSADGTRLFVKNPADASMPSYCAATLALMSRLYRKFDPVYADLCLTHAVYAYQYAKANPGTAGASGFYGANAKWQDDYLTACAELYWATGTAAYKTEAISYKGNLMDHNWAFCYSNNDDVAAYNLAKLGDNAGKTLLTTIVTRYKTKVNGAGVSTIGDAWGILRYGAGNAFAVALLSDLNGGTTVDSYVANQVDYILGKNTYNQSYVVGFKPAGCSTCKSVERPHHRNVFLCDNITQSSTTITIPTKNQEHGYMIGGSLDGSVSADAANYTTNEGGIDYNAGLVGAIGYILSRKAPIDTSKFGHPTPELGATKSLCGTGSATLTATANLSNLKVGETITYKWYKGASTTPFDQGDTKTSVTVTTADTYTCEIAEKTGAWSTKSSVDVTAVLPAVDLGADMQLCTETSKVLDAGTTGTGITYAWKKNNVAIPGATSKTYTVYTAGTYSVTTSASGCTAKTDDIIITSALPTVKNDTLCSPGTAALSVVTAGAYDWYDVATNGTKLNATTTSTYSPAIIASKTYYVQDASSVNGSVGPYTRLAGGTNWGVSAGNHLKFTVTSSFSLTSLKLNFGNIYNATSGTLTIEILDANGNPFTPAKTFVSENTAVTTGQSNSLVQINFTNCFIDKAWGTNLRMRISACSINAELMFNTTGATFPYNSNPAGVVSITGTSGGNSGANEYMYFYDWKISAGSTCSRTPVLAVVDPTNAKCSGDAVAPTVPGTITFSSTTATGMVASWTASTDNVAVTGYEVYVNNVLHSTVTTPTITLATLSCNTAYAVKVRAVDAKGNKSAFNTEKSNSTLGTATPVITNATPSVCEAGSFTLSIPTTTGATYAWTGPNAYTASTASITRTAATTAMSGTYSATITVNGCTSTAATTTVTVNAKPATPVITNATPSVCEAGSFTLSIPTTTGATYAWTGPGTYTASTASITRTAATTAMSGTYSATITVNGCTSTAATTTVTVNAKPATPVITNTTPSVCEGGSFTVSIPTTTGATYAWTGPGTYTASTASITRTAATTAMSGTYSATITVNGCTSTAATTTVTVNAIPAAPSVITPITYSVGDIASPLTAIGTGLKWYSAASGGTTLASAPTPITTVAGSQCYYVSQTENTCESTRASICINISQSTSNQTIALEQGWNLISIYVTPSDKTIATIFGAAISNVEIVKNANGFYKPGQAAQLQSLQTIETGYGYLVKMKAASTITISGALASNVSIPVKSGWNLIGYPLETASATTTAISSVWPQAQTIKNFDGFKDKTSGTLDTMSPGEGYYIFMNSAGTLQY